MKKAKFSVSTSKNLYMSEVLGLKSYLCPKPIFTLRSLKGGMACSVLNVLFKPLFSPQSHLLEKIMSSVGIVDFSCLEIKDLSLLEQMFRFEGEDKPADLVCFFGRESEGKKEWIKKMRGKELIQAQGLALKDFRVAEAQQSKTKDQTEQVVAKDQTGNQTKNQTKNQPRKPPWFFIQTVGLEELSGNSAPIRENKLALWNKLRQWKSLRQKL